MTPDPEYTLSSSMPPEKLGQILRDMPDGSSAELAEDMNIIFIDKIIPKPYSRDYNGIQEVKCRGYNQKLIDLIGDALRTLKTERELTDITYHNHHEVARHYYFYPRVDG